MAREMESTRELSPVTDLPNFTFSDGRIVRGRPALIAIGLDSTSPSKPLTNNKLVYFVYGREAITRVEAERLSSDFSRTIKYFRVHSHRKLIIIDENGVQIPKRGPGCQFYLEEPLDKEEEFVTVVRAKAIVKPQPEAVKVPGFTSGEIEGVARLVRSCLPDLQQLLSSQNPFEEVEFENIRFLSFPIEDEELMATIRLALTKVQDLVAYELGDIQAAFKDESFAKLLIGLSRLDRMRFDHQGEEVIGIELLLSVLKDKHFVRACRRDSSGIFKKPSQSEVIVFPDEDFEDEIEAL